MRIVFMGTAELACPCLEALAKRSEHDVVAVVTQPDRPKGRNLKPAPPPVKLTAERLHLPVEQPLKLRDPAAIDRLRSLRPDLMIVVAYGQILPPAVLEIPPKGCGNVHASLLPRWRGAAPIACAIRHGDPQTGVTTMYLDERMDTGDIIQQRVETIRPDDTAGTLQDRLAGIGADLLVETVALVARDQAPRRKQDDALATYAKKLAKEDGRIAWSKPAADIERQIRAFDPWPSAYTTWRGTLLKIWKAQVTALAAGTPGEVQPDLVVATGEGGLLLQEVQPPGGRRMAFDAFVRGHEFRAGDRLL